jgi:hypothetical protein
MYDPPANVIQNGPVSPVKILPYLERLFCGTTFPPSAANGSPVSTLGLPITNGIISLNLGAFGSNEGPLGSFCWNMDPSPLPQLLSSPVRQLAGFEKCFRDGASSFGLQPPATPQVSVFDPSCPMLAVIPQFLTVQNKGSSVGDVQINIEPTDGSTILDLLFESLGVLYPADPSEGIKPAFLPSVAAANATGSGSQLPSQATVAGATISSASGTSSRSRGLTLAGLAPGQTARLLVFTAAPLPSFGQVTLFNATISSAQDSNAANNSVTSIAGLTFVLPDSLAQPGKPVPPQAFQNPGAIQAVQQRPPRTPTPTPTPVR